MIAHIEEKRFGDKVIFRDAVFSIPAGSRTAVLGPSGCGKTTLMRILSGLDRDYKGFVEDAPEEPLILFQEDRLSENISVISNLMAVTNDRDAALRTLSGLGLRGEERTGISELSGGMRRRVAIARVLLLESDCLFLDEPFRGLDPETRSVVALMIMKYAAGRTLVLITHDEDELPLLGTDRIIRLD